MKFQLALGAALAVATAAGAVAAWAPSPAQERALASGKAVSEVAPASGGAGLIHAAVDIPAPASAVWMVMSECRFASKLVVTVTSCTILQGDAEHAGWDVRETVTRGNFFVPTIHNVVRADYQPFSSIRFHKVGGDLRQEEGEWRLEARAGGAVTRVIYVNLVAANILAPAPLVRDAMRRDTAKVLNNLRRETLAVAR